MSTLNLSKSTLEQLLAARRQMRSEFNDTLHLSGENLEQQLHHYRQLSSTPETRAILDACLISLGYPLNRLQLLKNPPFKAQSYQSYWKEQKQPKK